MSESNLTLDLDLFSEGVPEEGVSMGVGDYQRLLLCEKRLLKEAECIKDSLRTIKSEKISLNVEKLQLQSLIANPNTPSIPADNISEHIKEEKIKEEKLKSQLDVAESSTNTEKLDLSIVNDLTNILDGKFCAEEEESESEDEE